MAQHNTFGRLLAKLRRHRQLTQLQVAGDADISAKHLSFLETGRARPTRQMILRLSAAMGMSSQQRNELLLAAGYVPCMQVPDLSSHTHVASAGAVFDDALGIATAPSVSDALIRTARALEAFGLEHFFAGVLTPAAAPAAPMIRIRQGGRPPVGWLAHYEEHGYRSVDPLVQATARGHHAFFWHDIIRADRLSRPQHRMFSEAADFRIHTGVVVPIRWADGRVHAVSSMGRHVDPRDPSARMVIRTVCTALLERLETCNDTVAMADHKPQLQPRAVRYLQSIAQGLAVTDISDKYNRPSNEIRAAIADACVALGVTDERQAVMRASRYRLLNV